MIDANTLRALGWSEELIKAAGQVAGSVANVAIVGSVGGVTADLTYGATPTEGSQGADVSGPPVAQPQLRVGR